MQKLRILIADDDPITVVLLQSLLARWGYQEVVVARDGEEARTLLRNGGIHICILDWEMPRLNGRDLCWWIKSAELAPRPYVIMHTVHSSPEHVRTGYAAGADDYLTKPMDRDDLRYRLAAHALKVLRLDAEQNELGDFDPLDLYRKDLHYQEAH